MIANSYKIVLFNQFQSVFFLLALSLLEIILPQLYILWFESRRLIPSNEIEHQIHILILYLHIVELVSLDLGVFLHCICRFNFRNLHDLVILFNYFYL